MDKNGLKILSKLSGEISGRTDIECPSLEDISVLAEGKAGADLRKELQDHISTCDICYETYKSLLELSAGAPKKVIRIFSPLSVAASIFIVLVAFVIFYKVNISVSDLDHPVSSFSESPVILKEKKVSDKSEKKRIVTKIHKQKIKKDQNKPPAPEKSKKMESRIETVREEEAPVSKDEPSVNRSRNVIGNTQGISQAGNDPVTIPAALSVRTPQVESGGSGEKSGRLAIKRKKGGKGIVEIIREDDERADEKSSDFDCFKRNGEEYKRRKDFDTVIPLSEAMPGLIQVVQPDNFKVDEPVGEPVYIILEVVTGKSGTVSRVCLISGNVKNIRSIIHAVRKWKFKTAGDVPTRFRIVLGVTGNRIIEVLDKK